MTDRVDIGGGLGVDPVLHRFVREEALPGTGIDEQAFWDGFARVLTELGPRNAELLAARDRLQAAIDGWHLEHGGEIPDPAAYRAFLEEIGYLVPPGDPFAITTSGVDAEIAELSGPQLVVPVTNSRYALNAANARWGSLYDALYGTDALGSRPPAGPYDAGRGAAVIAWCRSFLDEVLPLERGSHANVTGYRTTDGALVADLAGGALVADGPDGPVGLADPSAFVGFQGKADHPSALFLRHHGLHVELVVDRERPVGRDDLAGVADVVIESAITTIVDCEDSVACVDADDKVDAYRNWLGLMKGDLTAEVDKGEGTFTRRLEEDRTITVSDGTERVLAGRALMLVRNVGIHMMTDAVVDASGRPVPEGLVDAMVTVLCALHDVQRGATAGSSRHGSIYVVKPKLHGPAEVAYVDATFSLVESLLGLPAHTVKIGLMDEERRTTVNLAECIRAAQARIAFINTGFLDRTGDEIHTSMRAGPVVRKADMRKERWFQCYEDHNVDVGLACGLRGKAQIGKGMWTAADLMADMLRDKIAHPQAGASCAWVPSPTAATLHAVHYHRVDVAERQAALVGGSRATIDDMLVLPLALDRPWGPDEIRQELDNDAQGILGYAVRWIDQGVGCSKVPDIHDVAQMEDRATCRISSQQIANWLHHGVVDRDTVLDTLRRMAVVVDRQNADDLAYRPMAPGYDGPAFQAACDLVFTGVEQPAGYTEPVLHARRRERKALDRQALDRQAPDRQDGQTGNDTSEEVR
ncbi:MAG: malate synthase G [Acidimicrobiales bacterium]